MRGVTIDVNNNIKTKGDIKEYIKPQVIYIPLESKTGVSYKHLVKENDYVFKGDVVAVNEKINFPLHSSVSGYVIAGTKKIMNNGKKIKCLVVENDFKEKYKDKVGKIEKLDNKKVLIDTPKGKEAILNYKVIKEKNNLSLVDINLITGRYHQIRLQFANINHPLYGDYLYNKKDTNKLALVCYSLSFVHPTTKENMNFELNPIENYIKL